MRGRVSRAECRGPGTAQRATVRARFRSRSVLGTECFACGPSRLWSQTELGGRLSGAGADEIAPAGDSRGDGRGQLLVSLRGERRDGHDPVAKDNSAKLRASSGVQRLLVPAALGPWPLALPTRRFG